MNTPHLPPSSASTSARPRFALRSRAGTLGAVAALAGLWAAAGCGGLLGIEPGILTGNDAGDASAAGDAAGADAGDAEVDAAEADGGVEAATPLDAAGVPDGNLPVTPDAASPDGAVASASDFALTIAPTDLSVVRGGSATATVTITPVGPDGGPAAGAVGPVQVTVQDVDPNVSAAPLTIPATSTKGLLTISAAANATLTVDGTLEITAASGSFSHTVKAPLVVRDPPGSLDLTFGTGGIATVPLAGAEASAGIGTQGLLVQPDGKIVFCGNGLIAGTAYSIILGRVSDSGSLDGSFGTGGLVVTNEPGHIVDVCGVVKLLPSQALVMGGFTLVPNDPNYPHAFLAAQFTAAGTLVPGFGAGGFFFDDVGGVDSKAYDMTVKPDGSLVLAGFSGSSYAFLGLTPAGAIDSAFGTSGNGTTLGMVTGSGASVALAPLASGDILAEIGATSFGAANLTANGGIDPAYAANGYVMLGAPSLTAVTGLLAQPDGKSVYVGTTAPAGGASGGIALARLGTDGTLDQSFGQAGLVSTAIPGGNTTSGPIVMTHDGGFAVSAMLPTATPIGIVRYDSTGTLDTAFAGVGYTGIPGTSLGEALAIDAAGRIVVATFTQNNAADTATVTIARFWP